MTSAEFTRVRKAVASGIKTSKQEAVASYVRDNIREIVDTLRSTPHVTVRVGDSEYRIDRDQLKSALR